MKGIVVGSLLALALMSGAVAEDARNVNIVNETGYGIKCLGFNNPGDDDWSDNELGSVLRNRGSVYVKFNTDDDGCVWNLKIEWADPGCPGVLWNDVDLCKISTLRLRYNRSTDTDVLRGGMIERSCVNVQPAEQIAAATSATGIREPVTTSSTAAAC
jgi:hypothetical protein